MPDIPGFIPVGVGGQPGIQRDGTVLSGMRYTEGTWTRFQRGLPRKIRGYQLADDHWPEISRGLYAAGQSGVTYAHSGSASFLQRQTIDSTLSATLPVDRTPAAFPANVNNVWQFDAMFNAAAFATNIVLIAHGAPNLSALDSSTTAPVYYGDLFGTSALVPVDPTGANDVSGGVVVLHPFLFIFGNGGNLTWSDANTPTNFTPGGSSQAGTARVTHEKIVKGMAVRGGAGYSPSGLFWSTDSLVRAYFVGGAPVFAFDVVSDQISVLSSSAIIEHDGLYFWPGKDRFMVYSGTVKELPNDTNLNFFYDNLNTQYAQKVFALKIPRWSEIWFCAPLFGATECNWAIIYNVRENCWYDTPLPDGGRCSGFYAQTIPYPLMMRAAIGANGWPLWIHEIGLDRNERGALQAIQSRFLTSVISRLKLQPPSPVATHIAQVEPDIVQSGVMTMNVLGSVNARGPQFIGPDHHFGPADELIYCKDERRQLRFRFESFTMGGDYQMGATYAHLGEGSKRIHS